MAWRSVGASASTGGTHRAPSSGLSMTAVATARGVVRHGVYPSLALTLARCRVGLPSIVNLISPDTQGLDLSGSYL